MIQKAIPSLPAHAQIQKMSCPVVIGVKPSKNTHRVWTKEAKMFMDKEHNSYVDKTARNLICRKLCVMQRETPEASTTCMARVTWLMEQHSFWLTILDINNSSKKPTFFIYSCVFLIFICFKMVIYANGEATVKYSAVDNWHFQWT